MTVMGSENKPAETPKTPEAGDHSVETTVPTANVPPTKTKKTTETKDENAFSQGNLSKATSVQEVTFGNKKKTFDLEPSDKVAFLDAIVNNTRFTKDYALFGGKVTLTLRSLTNDEVNALSSYIAKQGSSDSAGLLAGRYRKYLVAAQVAMFNGVQMPPLEEPLFETLGKDGKTILPPGWIGRCAYWDSMSVGLFGAIMGCIEDFDARYALLCQKAEDSNFWHPDTP